MNFSEIKESVYDYVDDAAQDQFPESQVGRLINSAWRMIARKLDAQDEDYFVKCDTFSVVTTTNVDHVFDLPSDFKRVIVVERIEGTDRPTPVEWVEFRARHTQDNWPSQRLNDPNAPRCFLYGKKWGVVSPSEDMTLRMWYAYSPADLSDGTDTPSELPADHHDTIALLAAKLAHSGIEGKGFLLQSELDQGMRDLTRVTHSRNRQQTRMVHHIERD